MMKLSNVCLGYDKENPLLKGVNISLNVGKIHILCGSSGIGKTTLFRGMTGYLAPYEGEISVEDKDIYSFKKDEMNRYRRETVSYLPQEYCLIDSLCVIDNICLAAMMSKNNKDYSDLNVNAKELLKKLGMDSYQKRFPKELSGGEIRRVEIIQHLLKDSPIIIMDEPTNNLDDNCVKILTELLYDDSPVKS